MKTDVNAFSLIKRPCDLVPLQIIKVNGIKVKLWPNSDQAYRCNAVNTRNVIIHGGFDQRVHYDIVIAYSLPDILCWECKCTCIDFIVSVDRKCYLSLVWCVLVSPELNILKDFQALL